jgi:uncharacterized protein
LGSASPGLLRQTSESLAGRAYVLDVEGFSAEEVGPRAQERHWRRGGFPLSFLARTESASWAWREHFVRHLLERDMPLLGVGIPAPTLLRFWSMVAHYHGQVWNNAEPARSLGVSEPTIRRYLDLMSGVFMVRQLQPWHENLAKRQVKSPKVYVRDSGILHHLIGTRTQTELLRHPKVGASWEGYVVEQLLRALAPDQAYFWATHAGAELDLLLMHRGRRYGIEIKRADAPTMTPSIRTALVDLDLTALTVIYPGTQRYTLERRVRVVPVNELATASWATLFK